MQMADCLEKMLQKSFGLMTECGGQVDMANTDVMQHARMSIENGLKGTYLYIKVDISCDRDSYRVSNLHSKE